MKFQIGKEQKTPDYRVDPGKPLHRVKNIALPLLAGILGVTGISSSANAETGDVHTAGVPVYNPTIHSVTEMTAIVDSTILDHLGIKMKHNVPLKIKSGDGKTIDFIADGYNADKKLAYEWVTAPDYSKDKKDNEILTTNEIALIKGKVFDETTILVIEKNDKAGMRQYVSKYMIIMKNKDKK